MVVSELARALFLAMQYSSPQKRPSVIFVVTISLAETVPASECSHQKTENRVLDVLAGPATFEEMTRGFHTAVVVGVPLHWVPFPCPTVAFHRPRTVTDGPPETEAPSRGL